MREDLDGRLRRLRACRDADAVIELGCDLAGAMRAYRGAGAAGDTQGGLQLAFLLHEQGEHKQAIAVAAELAATGDDVAAAVVACWRWAASYDTSLDRKSVV